ncbi:hypothetical protein B0H12DRAFT_463141 [Mycena haematopus]|nr:hypothetical protein B0H12DRAFT_463141 [Mycena haematopus]
MAAELTAALQRSDHTRKPPEITLGRNSSYKKHEKAGTINHSVILPGTEDGDGPLDFEVPDLFIDYAKKSIRILGVAAARMKKQTPADAARMQLNVAAYFVKACFSKLQHRLKNVTEEYDVAVLGALDCTKFGDSLGQQYIRVKNEGLALVLKETMAEDTAGFLFDKTTVALWWDWAIKMLKYLARLKDTDADEATVISSTLHSLLHALPISFWRSQRLADHLLCCRRSRKAPQDPIQSGDEETREQNVTPVNTTDEEEEESIDEALPSSNVFVNLTDTLF